MEQYIPKSALLNWAKETYLCENASMIRKVCYKQLVEHLNTIKVKEVNLDEEIRKESDKYYDECEKKLYKIKDDDTDMSFLQLDSFAKHFFELGMTASNKAQKGEEV